MELRDFVIFACALVVMTILDIVAYAAFSLPKSHETNVILAATVTIISAIRRPHRQGRRAMSGELIEPVFYEVCNMEPPSAPFAVLAIYPNRREGNGCAAIVESLHQNELEAEAACAALKGSVQ